MIVDERRGARSRCGRAAGRVADGPRLARRVRAQGQLAVGLDPLMVAFFVAVLRLAAPVPAAAPRPAGPARVLRCRTSSSTAGRSSPRCRSSIRCWATCWSACCCRLRRAAADRRARCRSVGAGRLAGAGADLPGRFPGRPERDQLERDRRRLLGRDRRRSHHPWRGALRRVPDRQPIRRHIRARQLLRLRAVRALVPVVRQVGRPAGGARRGAVLRRGHDPGVVLGRQAAAPGP